MKHDLRLFWLAVGLPALVLACAGIRLVQIERHRCTRQDASVQQCLHANGGSTEKIGDCPHCQRRAACGPLGVFSDEDVMAPERVMWIGGCVVGLLFLSLASGSWLLVRAARQAREDALRKTDFVANVSHEFKTPLTTISLCTELAREEEDPARRNHLLENAASEIERLRGLVTAVLDFGRLERGRHTFTFENADLAEIVRQTAEPMRPRFAANGLTMTLPNEPTPACVDVPAVREILVILLENAAKYAASQGPVEASVTPASGHHGARITVADRGPGLDKEGLRRIFDRFWRGDNATTAETGGSGLGLAIARELAKGMKAKLSVARRSGGGLTFTLEVRA